MYNIMNRLIGKVVNTNLVSKSLGTNSGYVAENNLTP